MPSSFAYRYSPLVLAFVVAFSGAAFKPSKDGSLSPAESVEEVMEFLGSFWFLLCLGLCVAGTYWSFSKDRRTDFKLFENDTEKGLAMWHLTNATWWSFGCDVLSGYFGVMPLLTSHYDTVDGKHSLSPGAFATLGDGTRAPALTRSGLDAVYLCELCIHVPLAWTVFWAYHHDAPWKRTLESVLCAVQITGTVCYYLPEILDGSHYYPEGGIALWFGVYFGLLWIALPVLIVVRNIRLDALQSRKSKRA